ncbi:MAG: coiled-coil domain-containing protein [Planctomycetota bacterium]|jgi:hypothetical protein
MIEEALRKRLQPIVKRRRRLHLAYYLSVCWLVAALAGIGLICANLFWGWNSPVANRALFISTALATLYVLYRSRRMGPDYRAVARHIELQNPDMQALLLAAIEQQPDQPDGQFGYLQNKVIGEAVRHATKHDWLQSISTKKLLLSELGGALAFTLIITTLLQLFPSVPFLRVANLNIQQSRGYEITVSPGDTSVEAGSPVVVLARFGRRVPPKATLLFGEPGKQFEQIPLTRNLDDPVFGGIIQQVNSNLLYYVEYADKRSRDFRISIFERPVLTRADAKIIFPSYTKLPEKVIKDTRQVSAVEGSQITLTFVLNKAVATAQLVPKEGPGPKLSVDSEHPNVYTTSITATKNQRYELHLADAQGLTNELPQRFVIDVHKNLPPELRVVFPNRDVLASPLEELSLEAEVSDDYGLTGYGFSYALAGAEGMDVALGTSPLPGDKQQIQHLLALEELSAEPDQLLTYYFWVDDVGPDGDVRRTSGDMYFAEIRPFEEVFREGQSSRNQQNQNQQGQQQGNQQGGQLAELQKQIISATWNIKRRADQSGLDDSKEDLGIVHQSQADVLELARSASAQAEDPAATKTLQAAAGHMETSLEHLGEAVGSESATELMPALAAEQSAYQELLKLRQREHQVGQNRGSGRNSGARSARSEQQLQQLELTQRENRYETERLAQSQQQQAQREDLQVLNRLRDLARRQNEMSDKLKEVQAALRQARTEEQKQEIQRELKRLRQEQLEAMRDIDELQRRMDSPENRRRMADASEQLDQSRSRIRQSAEELERGMVSRAVTSTTRAQRQLEQMRDEFRRNTSGQFSERMRDMRQQARQLDRRLDSERKSLTDPGVNRELAERMNRQKENLGELLEQMKDVSGQAETSEPLLSRKLYDTLRKTSSDNLDRALEVTSELLRRNFLPQAKDVEKRAGKGIEELKKGVEDAADSVLGDEAESLRLAKQQLDELIRQVDEEATRAGGGTRRDGDPNRPAGSASNQQQLADAQSENGRGRQGDPNRPGGTATNQRQLADAQSETGRGQQGDPNGPADMMREGRPRAEGVPPSDRGQDARDTISGARADQTGGGGNQRGRWDRFDPNGPLTGRDFRQWSDRLRDVEEMLSEPDFRNDVARVRDRARAVRAEFTRHGKEPQWNLVEQQITSPLTELRNRIVEELAKLKSDEAMVPIDRDPVPGRFAELVRRYYENLGGDE